MNLIKPKRLKKGDTIGIIALSGHTKFPENIIRAKKYFEKKGFNIVFSKNIFDKNRYLAGFDKIKIEELHRFFQDKNINAILCSRGGFGAIRLINDIDYNIIKNNPKIFAGYSDTTALEAMILKKTGLITFYSPIAHSDFGASEICKYTEENFFNTMTNTSSLIITPENESKTYFEGNAAGILFGGNLATITSLCGQDFIPDEKFIFFAEDLGEETYKIDKMMTQLLNIEKFNNNLQGIILGEFLDVSNKKDFDELFYEIGTKINKPILSGFKITHDTEKLTIPYGANAQFSTSDQKLVIANYLL